MDLGEPIYDVYDEEESQEGELCMFEECKLGEKLGETKTQYKPSILPYLPSSSTKYPSLSTLTSNSLPQNQPNLGVSDEKLTYS